MGVALGKWYERLIRRRILVKKGLINFLPSLGDWPEDLQALNVTSITDSECKRTFEGDVHESHLCAICASGHGVCNRDSGGPLALDNELVGIVNWSEGCGTGKPEGYAKISYFYSWIEKKLKTE